MTDIIEEYFDKIEYQLEKKRIEKPTVDARYVRPVEATKKIRMAGNVNQTVWIKSVCGYGKTSFIADYLKNRKYDYYSAQEQSPYQVELSLIHI